MLDIHSACCCCNTFDTRLFSAIYQCVIFSTILLADVKYGLRSGVTYTFGRLKADFIFDDSSLSRTHAEIKVSPKGEGVIIKGQAHDMFSRIFRRRIYIFFLPNIM